MLRRLKRDAVAGFSSTLSLVTRTRPAISAASSSMTGAIALHGMHHAAHASTRTGSGERSTSAENESSVTVMGLMPGGLVPGGNGDLQRPQTATRPRSILSRGTRLAAPHAGQRIRSASDMAWAARDWPRRQGFLSRMSSCEGHGYIGIELMVWSASR